MQPTVAIDQNTVRAIDGTIANIAIAAKKSVGSVIVQATVFAAQSARKATPMAPKNRKTLRNFRQYGEKRRKAENIPWWAAYELEIYKQGEPRSIFVSSSERLNKLKPVPHRGVAKAAWLGGLRFLGKRQNLPPIANKASGAIVKRDGEDIVSVRLENRIRYIAKAAPQSANVGLQKAEARMRSIYLKQVDRNVQRQMRAGNRLLGAIISG